jgi:DNA-binding transcriptional ArsR family regulator
MQETHYRATRILKALGNPLRYRILIRLTHGPATPSELARELNRSIYAISRTLALLRALDLVCYHCRTPYVIYEAKYDTVLPLLAAAHRCAEVTRTLDAAAPAPH